MRSKSAFFGAVVWVLLSQRSAAATETTTTASAASVSVVSAEWHTQYATRGRTIAVDGSSNSAEERVLLSSWGGLVAGAGLLGLEVQRRQKKDRIGFAEVRGDRVPESGYAAGRQSPQTRAVDTCVGIRTVMVTADFVVRSRMVGRTIADLDDKLAKAGWQLSKLSVDIPPLVDAGRGFDDFRQLAEGLLYPGGDDVPPISRLNMLIDSGQKLISLIESSQTRLAG